MKKWIILALIIVCLISLVGCRPDKQTPQPKPSGKIERTEEPDTYPPTNIDPGYDLDEPGEPPK